jgi:sugar/nucleoside kinase (ribokinase family)
MKMAIASNIVLDRIIDRDRNIFESLGGPACYSGLTARRFGLDVIIATKIGIDFSYENMDFLKENGIMLNKHHAISDEFPTTRFQIDLNKEEEEEEERQLILSSKCSPLTIEDVQDIRTDCWLISPIIDEVPPNVLKTLVHDGKTTNFVMLDPQGYTRVVNSSGQISLLKNLQLDLSGITALKADKNELGALTKGLQGLAGMRLLQSTYGISFVISTEDTLIQFLHNDRHYWIKLQEMDTTDSTGLGDILSSAFCCALLKEKDPLWAICFGAGAVTAALDTRKTGLNKVPSKSKIENDASYFYNTISFRRL